MSLTASLNIATQALFAATAEIQTTNNNIANANTPGYTREVVDLQSVVPDSSAGPNPGNGVQIQGFHSVRDEILQSQIEQQTQTQSQANAELTSLQQIQPLFTTSSNDIGTEMSALFTAISTLSTNPTNSADRQSVLSAGANLARAFNTASGSLTQLQTGLNNQVSQDVSQINQLTSQIAALNPQIQQAVAMGSDPGTLKDQQDQLVLKLSNLTGVSVVSTESGITVTTGSGTPLVVGSQSYNLQTATAGGMVQVEDANGNNITSTIQGGDLGGTITTRDQTIPNVLNQLDTLAYQVGTAFNAAQATGYDQNGNKGGNFFNLPASSAGAAASISVALTDPAQIAASSDGTSGSNGNLSNFTSIQNTPLPSGETPIDTYSSLVYQVGNQTANAQAEYNATGSNLKQLNDQLASISGVSIDQESTNLIGFQQSYEAAARVITTVQALFQVTMSMGTASAA